MEYENYDDLLAVEDYEMYDNTIEDHYGDYDDDTESALDDLYDALMEAQESGDLGEMMENFAEKKRPRKRPRRPPPRSLMRNLPTPAPKKGNCCIDPRVSRDLATLKQQNAQQDRKLRDIEGLARKNLSVNTTQTKNIGKFHKQMKLDGALDFASAFSFVEEKIEGVQVTRLIVDPIQVCRGFIKTGVLKPSGFFENPMFFAVLGLAFKNFDRLRDSFARPTNSTNS